MTINKIEERQPAAVPQLLWTTSPPANRWDDLAAALQPPAPAERKDQDVFAAMQSRAIAAMKKIVAAGALQPNKQSEAELADLERIQNAVREHAAEELIPGQKYDIFTKISGYNWEPQDMDGEALECFSRNLCKLSADDVIDASERALFEAHRVVNAHNAAIDAEANTPYDAVSDIMSPDEYLAGGDLNHPDTTPSLRDPEEFTQEEPASAISILQEIARGRTMPGDACTPEEAQWVMYHIENNDCSDLEAEIDFASQALGWTERSDWYKDLAAFHLK